MCLLKPRELLALYDESARLFALVQERFEVPSQHYLDITSVDRDPERSNGLDTTAALALHYTQSLRVLATPGRKVKIASIVNTSACLHAMLTALAGGCESPQLTSELLKVRDRIGDAAQHVGEADIRNGSNHSYMR